ncbi:MAG: serine protease [Lyngbya sp. HA4199-MV5]|jgi:V8-like Glu-specific endopeptidase|nr:serine protease [Lyngbya sp. HA4199-MV5]
MVLILQDQERQRLADLLMGLYDITDGSRSRRVFVENTAGLGRFISSLGLSSSNRIFAWELVGCTEKFGQLPERSSYHSLGALLNAILGLSDVGNEDAKFIASLIVRYSLIADPYYLETLRDQYDLNERVVREPPPDAIPPRPSLGKADNSPEFKVEINRVQELEAITNSADNFLDIHQLSGALYCAEAVARIETSDGKAIGTGFLIGPDWLLTNQHVLKKQSDLEEAVARFNFVNDFVGIPSKGKAVKIRTDCYFSSPEEKLDYALVRLQDRPIEKEKLATPNEIREKSMDELLRMGKHQGYLTVVARGFTEHHRVNIIQHPDGSPLKVVMTQNYVTHSTDSRVQYLADTMGGSSGSPIFNNQWEVVALHHSGTRLTEQLPQFIKPALKGSFLFNEGIPMRAILKDFELKGIDRHLQLR